MKNILIENIKGVGIKTKEVFYNYNIKSAYDLLLSYPIKYQYFQLELPNRESHNKVITVKLKVLTKIHIKRFSKISAASFKAINNQMEINVLAFRREYLKSSLNVNDEIIIKGKFDYYKNLIVANKVISIKSYKEIKPIYNFINILDVNVSKIVAEIYKNTNNEIEENLPQTIISKNNLLLRSKAIKQLHLPQTKKNLQEAINRMKYEEAYFFQKDIIKKVNKPLLRNPIKYNLEKIQSFINEIPYSLTNDQKMAVNDIFRDFKLHKVTYRLIQGDVGSGKTIVVAIGAYGAVTANLQVAIMAPTELLANQHYNYFNNLFKNKLKIAQLTGKTKNKKEIRSDLLKNKIDILIGTHALIEDDVIFNKLGLIIVDEQHKFGVRTRNSLFKKSEKANLIYLTATPIPRTLAISLFNEAKITTIKEKPSTRVKVKTKIVDPFNSDYVYDEINKTLNNNEKIFIVVPAITSTHATHNINTIYNDLIKHIRKDYIYTLHGQINNEIKSEVMEQFIKTKKGVLIATTMIEVGIDVKDATLIIIYSANYFGLSQLHQLRGRVGRSNLPSQCLLISTKDDVERLKLLTKIDDGFLISKYDLKLRGPGALIGLEQTGFPNFRFLNFIKDYKILEKARLDIKSG